MTAARNGTIRTARDAARHYLKSGVFTVPVEKHGKRPWDFRLGCLRSAWEQLRVSEDAIGDLFPDEANIGIVLGEPSRGLVDVDLDSPEAIAAAPLSLPATDLIGGRESAPASHRFYLTDDPPAKATEQFHDPVTGELLLELRSTGGQTVIPPSVYGAEPDKGHPTAERSIWHRHGKPAQVDAAVLMTNIRAVAAAAMLAKHWPGPPKRTRHKAALALAGILHRAGWLQDAAEKFITAICAAAGDDEVNDRLFAVRSTFDPDNTKNKTGQPKLALALGGARREDRRAARRVAEHPAHQPPRDRQLGAIV